MPAFRWLIRTCVAVLLPAMTGFSVAATPMTPLGVNAGERQEVVERLSALLKQEYVDPATAARLESIGVKPDVEVNPEQAPKAAARLALQTLIEHGDTPDRIATWKQLLAEPPEP